VTSSGPAASRSRVARQAPRVGLFGLLGQGNLGNDGSLEAVLAYLRAEHPEAVLDAMCSGPELVTERYRLPAVHLHWQYPEQHRTAGRVGRLRRLAMLGLGAGIDTIRTASWVRRHDAVIVPGMGVLEVTVPMRPWQTPYSMFLLSVSGRLFRTKVAYVSVGTNVIHEPLMRRLMTTAARLAHYRSFRDTISKDAMSQMGLDTSGDAVFPDVVFSLPVPDNEKKPTGAVGVGIMDYSGANEDRREGDRIRSGYVEQITSFVLWLVDNGRRVRLFTSDTADEPVVRQVLDEVRKQRPGLDSERIVAESAPSLAELLRQTAEVDIVVASRFHNVLYAMRMGKPTLSLGYAAKHDVLMADMGMSRFTQPLKSLNLTRLIEQFTDLEHDAVQVRRTIADRNASQAQLVSSQFTELSAVLFPAGRAVSAGSGQLPIRSGSPLGGNRHDDQRDKH
jgi:polysaccharide pyruvyl transferase WcaK-like protein